MKPRHELGTALNIIDETILVKLTCGLEDALHYQQQVGAIYVPAIKKGDGVEYVTTKEINTDFTQLQTALNKLLSKSGDDSKAYRRLSEIFSHIPIELRHYLDSVYSVVNGTELETYTPHQSACERIAGYLSTMNEGIRDKPVKALRNAVESVLQNISTPGKGGARKEAKRYIAGIACLARHFSEALPSRSISSEQYSIFHNYVVFWLQNYVLVDINSAERHIQNTIESGESLTF